MDRPRSVSLPWYERDAYPAMRAMAADGHKMPASYDQWRFSAEQVEAEIVRSGVAVERVPIAPALFAEWCAERGVKADSAARSRFATEQWERGRANP